VHADDAARLSMRDSRPCKRAANGALLPGTDPASAAYAAELLADLAA
jgi:hypothetical protein